MAPQPASPRPGTLLSRRNLMWLVLLVDVAVMLVMAVLPMRLIHPFRHQTERGLDLGFALRRLAPMVTLICLAPPLLVWLLLGARRRWSRVAAGAVFCLGLLVAFVARQNVFERMFAPLRSPAYASPAYVTWLDDQDHVIVVSLHGESVAYPVRQLAYHHIVHDVVGGVPIAVTY